MNQISVERDDLVEKYMGSQRIAITLGRDNLERAMQQGLSQMMDNTKI